MSYENFNSNLENFVRNLTSNFGDVVEFRQLKTAITLSKNLNEKKPEHMFREYVVDRYRKEIMTRNENFFLNPHSFQNQLDGIITGETDFDLLFAKLKELWTTLDEPSKKQIWDWITVLIVLSDKCHRTK